MQSTPPKHSNHHTHNLSAQVSVFPQQGQITTNVFLKLDLFFLNKTNNTKTLTEQHAQINLVLV